ncbi:BarA sensory histidine kinase (= VarS = GacS) [hydrothermal vent metagenome]|uniref:histidine kinase n=1 Tax=hydrothermal vent metagenome TaxID=652676 RepID=A0A3B0XVY4_9ZZZZ
MVKINVFNRSIAMSVVVILTLTAGAAVQLYYFTQKMIANEIELRLSNLVTAEQKKLVVLTRDWKTLLTMISRQKLLKQYAAASYHDNKRELARLQPTLEKMLLNYSLLKPNLIKYIRFINSKGNEIALVKNGKVSHSYKNRNYRTYFTLTKIRKNYEINDPTYRQGGKYTALDWSVRIGNKKQFHGVLTMTLDLSQIRTITASTQAAGVYDDYYLLDSLGRVILGPATQVLGASVPSFKEVISLNKRFTDRINNIVAVKYIAPINAYTALVIHSSSIDEWHQRIYQPIVSVLIICCLFIIILVVTLSKRMCRMVKNSHQLQYDRDKLNEMVCLKTSELQLATQEAEHASKIKSEFLANMSHEIRTPMNGVLGLLELIQQTALTEEQQKYLTTAYASGQSLLSIINDILDFSKIEANMIELELINVNLKSLLEETKDLYFPMANDKKLALHLEVDSNVPEWVKLDPTRLRQVLNNLLNNAIKFTRVGSVSLIVSADSSTMPVIKFSIVDTGIGISDKVKLNIFQSFSQADVSTTRQFGGTGLGLAISKKLVEKFNSSLEISSVPNEGSTFYFSMQVALGHGVEVVRDTHHSNTKHDGKIHVLVISSIPSAGEETKKILEKASCLVSVCSQLCEVAGIVKYANSTNKPIVALVLNNEPIGQSLKIWKNQLKQVVDTDSIKFLYLSLGKNESELDDCLNKLEDAGFHALISDSCGLGRIKPLLIELDYTSASGNVVHVKQGDFSKCQRQYDKDKTVLVAEDNTVNQIVVKGMLDELGYCCQIVSNGLKAVEEYKKGGYALILMDMQMPVLDGIEATKAIRSISGEYQIPIIALTANAMAEDKSRCLEAGMDDFISKPLCLAKLKDKLTDWLNINREDTKISNSSS